MTALPLALAVLLSLLVLRFLYLEEGTCPFCQGRGRHRTGCPRERE